MPDCCMFCGSPLKGNRAKEHIIPVWLQEYLGITKKSVSPTHHSYSFDDDGNISTTIRSSRSLTYNKLLAGHVCRACNSGWMNDLEESVRPNLKRLISSSSHDPTLTASDRIHLSRWVAKTAYVLHESSNFARLVPTRHYRWLYDEQEGLAESVGAVLGISDQYVDIDWQQQSNWIGIAPSESLESDFARLGKQSYKIGLQFGHLMLAVFWWPDSRFKYSLERDHHRGLWPVMGPIYWKSDGSSRNDGPWPVKVATSFQEFLWGIGVGIVGLPDGHRMPEETRMFHFTYEDTRP